MSKLSKGLVYLISLLILINCTGCGDIQESSINNSKIEVISTHNPTGEEILNNNPNADIFIFNNTVYENATNIQWVKELTLTLGEKVGAITKQYIKDSKFENGVATILPINSNIYKSVGDRSDEVLIVKYDDKIIRYLALVEG